MIGSDGLEKGGLMRPIFGVIMNFWCVVGIWRFSSIRRDRSLIVASDARSRMCEVPWWVIVTLLVGLLFASGLDGAPSRDGAAGGFSTSVIAGLFCWGFRSNKE